MGTYNPLVGMYTSVTSLIHLHTHVQCYCLTQKVPYYDLLKHDSHLNKGIYVCTTMCIYFVYISSVHVLIVVPHTQLCMGLM